jgi:hypothetical protein
MYPEAKSVGLWLRHAWHVAIAYFVGFFVMLAILGWQADANHRKRAEFQGQRDIALAQIHAVLKSA